MFDSTSRQPQVAIHLYICIIRRDLPDCVPRTDGTIENALPFANFYTKCEQEWTWRQSGKWSFRRDGLLDCGLVLRKSHDENGRSVGIRDHPHAVFKVLFQKCPKRLTLGQT